jgi:hypothetical protein
VTLSAEDIARDEADERERLRPHRAELDALRARREAAGWHPVDAAQRPPQNDHRGGDPAITPEEASS